MKKHNFSAGPSILPRVAIENAAKAILDFNGMGLSLLEISHRTPDFEAVNDEAEALLRFGAKAGACLAGQALLFKAPRNLCAAPE